MPRQRVAPAALLRSGVDEPGGAADRLRGNSGVPRERRQRRQGRVSRRSAGELPLRRAARARRGAGLLRRRAGHGRLDAALQYAPLLRRRGRRSVEDARRAADTRRRARAPRRAHGPALRGHRRRPRAAQARPRRFGHAAVAQPPPRRIQDRHERRKLAGRPEQRRGAARDTRAARAQHTGAEPLAPGPERAPVERLRQPVPHRWRALRIRARHVAARRDAAGRARHPALRPRGFIRLLQRRRARHHAPSRHARDGAAVHIRP